MEFIYEKEKRSPIEIKYPKGFEKWIEKEMLTAVIYNRWAKKAYCVHCGHTWDYTRDFDIRANKYVTCPLCNKTQLARPHTSESHSWKGFFWIWNEKHGINFAVVGAWWHYSKQPLEELSLPVSIALEMCGRISNSESSCFTYYPFWKKWEPGSMSIDSQCDYPAHYPGNKAVLKRSFLKHCAEYILLEAGATAQLKFMRFFAKHPQAEYIEKAGFGELINSCVWRFPLHIWPNWNARTVPGVLRLSPQDVDKLKAWDMFDLFDVARYHLIRKYKKNPKREDMIVVRNSGFEIEDFRELMEPGTSPMKFVRYMQKQVDLLRSRRNEDPEYNVPMCHTGYYYYTPESDESRVRTEYRDYRNLMDKLGYPKDDYYVYPKDLFAAHDAAAVEYNGVLDEQQAEQRRKCEEQLKKLNEKFGETLSELERFAYEDDPFLIRPLRNEQDFIDEGRNNHNCVASYWEKELRGSSRIFVLRKKKEPDVSYVTIELSPDNKLRQCLATGNRLPSDEVKAWVDKWLKCIVANRIKDSAPGAAENGGQILCQTA